MIKRILTVFLFFTALLSAQNMPKVYTTGAVAADKQLGNSILDFAFNGDTMWIGTSKGLSKTTDEGESWINYYNNDAFGTESITALGFYDGVIYAATGHTEERNGSELSAGSGLRYSTDNGNTWVVTEQPLDAEDDTTVTYGVNTLRALPVTVTPNNISYDIAFTPGTIWIATFAGGLRKSTDMGETWQRVVLPPDYLDYIHPDSTYSFSLQPVAGNFGTENNLNHRVFSLAAANDSVIYVGTAGGINRGTIREDGEIIWRKFNHNSQDYPISGNFVTALSYDKVSGAIWGATWKAEGTDEYYAVSASWDEGKNWSTFLEGERAHNFGFKHSTGGFGATEVFAATDEGLFRTADAGQSWITAPAIYDDERYLSVEGSVFYAVAAREYGPDDIIWIGTAGDGLVKFNQTGNGWDGEWNILLASQKLVTTSETYAFPNPFSPLQESTRIKYSASGQDTEVTIRILDFGMNLVRTLVQNAPRNARDELFEVWDGKDDSGTYVPNGVYFYRIDLGSGDPLFGKIMVVK